jgi:hypothetical protein
MPASAVERLLRSLLTGIAVVRFARIRDNRSGSSSAGVRVAGSQTGACETSRTLARSARVPGEYRSAGLLIRQRRVGRCRSLILRTRRGRHHYRPGHLPHFDPLTGEWSQRSDVLLIAVHSTRGHAWHTKLVKQSCACLELVSDLKRAETSCKQV